MKKILFLILSACCLSACSEFLDREPENAVTFSNYFKNEKEVQTAVESMHATFRACFGSVDNRLWRQRALNFDYLDADSEKLKENNFQDTYDKYSPILYWDNEYRVVAMANMVIDNIAMAELPEERHDFYLGQAYFVWAYTYFRLIQYWGDVPLVEHMEDISVKPRTSWLTVCDRIVGYATEATRLLPSDGERRDAEGRAIIDKQIPSSGSAWDLLAYVYGWRAQLNQQPELLSLALEACNKVIDSGDYQLAADIQEVTQSVLLGDSKEAIYELNYSQLAGEENDIGACIAGVCQVYPVELNSTPSTPRFYMGIEFATVFDMYPEESDDRRTWFYELEETSRLPYSETEGFAYPYKYQYPLRYESGYMEGEVRAYENNEPLIRLAAIYLLRAEYRAKTGDYGGAVADLNVVRRRAGCSDYSGGTEELRREISRERDRELFCEGDRFLDLVREGFVEDLPGFRDMTQQDIENGRLFIPLSRTAFQNNTQMTQCPYWEQRGF